jgi:hypothetical protein
VEYVKRLVRAGEGVWALEYRNDIANQTNTHTNYIYLHIFFKYVQVYVTVVDLLELASCS